MFGKHAKENWLYYIDEAFSEASPEVLYEGRLAGVVFQQDKVLHADPVTGCQGALHHQTHSAFNVHLLQAAKQRGSDTTAQYFCSSS